MSGQDAPGLNRSPEERERNRPKHRITAPLRSRHTVEGIPGRSQPKALNSIVLPGVDTGRDTELIREGYGDSLGNNRWHVNGRVYVRKGDELGRLYPEHGEGVRILTRAEFRCLVLLASYGGYTPEVRTQVAHDDYLTDADLHVALELYSLLPEK